MTRATISASVLVAFLIGAAGAAEPEKDTPEKKPMQTTTQIPEIDIAAAQVKTKTATFALG